MVMIRHPLNRAEYRKRDDGLVSVTWTDGANGVFDRNGDWIMGNKRRNDPAVGDGRCEARNQGQHSIARVDSDFRNQGIRPRWSARPC